MNVAVYLDFNISDDDGLSYVYFDLGDFSYFTVSFNEDEDELPYLELNEQSFSIHSKGFTYNFKNNYISFIFEEHVMNALNSEKALVISLENIDEEKILEMLKVLDFITQF